MISPDAESIDVLVSFSVVSTGFWCPEIPKNESGTHCLRICFQESDSATRRSVILVRAVVFSFSVEQSVAESIAKACEESLLPPAEPSPTQFFRESRLLKFWREFGEVSHEVHVLDQRAPGRVPWYQARLRPVLQVLDVP